MPTMSLIASMDSTFTGEDEVLINVEIEDSSPHTIVVRDFFGEPAGYTLAISESVGSSGSIFVYSDDDGDSGTQTSAVEIVDVLGNFYDVELFVASQNGPLDISDLDGTSLVIWDSGDFADSTPDADDDVLIEYIGSGRNILFFGSTPTVFTGFDSSALSDVTVVDSGNVITNGFVDGQVITLSQTVQSLLIEADEPDDVETWYMLRGPSSADSGVMISFVSEPPDGSKFGAVFLPLWTMPEDDRILLLFNLVEYYGVEPN